MIEDLTLADLRVKIDAIDKELLRLLNERADVVHGVGVIKKRDGLQIYAPEREQSLLKKLVSMSDGRLPEKSIRAIYREIMSAALALEEDLKIACLGPEGTWSHQAAIAKFGASVEYQLQFNLEDVFDAVERGKADYGVVPIENSSGGAVTDTLDRFAESPLTICAEILQPIENNLISKIPREEIKEIHSHPQVISQCRDWLARTMHGIELVKTSSTAKAAQNAATQPGVAALGSALLAQIHDLDVLEESIQDVANNTTRFLVINEKTCPPTGKDRTSLVFSVGNAPGALRNALAPFDDFQVNMSKIESRPSRRQNWEYLFFVDVAGHCEDDTLVAALKHLRKECSFVKLLGSYPDNS